MCIGAHAVIGNGNHIRLAQVGGVDDLFEIAVCDLVSLLEALGVALALGGVLIALLARVGKRELVSGLIGLYLVAHQKIEVMVLHGEEHRVVQVNRQSFQLLHVGR